MFSGCASVGQMDCAFQQSIAWHDASASQSLHNVMMASGNVISAKLSPNRTCTARFVYHMMSYMRRQGMHAPTPSHGHLPAWLPAQLPQFLLWTACARLVLCAYDSRCRASTTNFVLRNAVLPPLAGSILHIRCSSAQHADRSGLGR